MSNHIVTRESLTSLISVENPEFVNRVIGRALVALYDRQTAAEKNATSTLNDNDIGFTGADARQGSLTARYFLKHGTLLEWQRELWTKRNVRGVPRLAKYWKQLDEVAQAKARAKELASHG